MEAKLQSEKEFLDTIKSEYNLMQNILKQMGDHQVPFLHLYLTKSRK